MRNKSCKAIRKAIRIARESGEPYALGARAIRKQFKLAKSGKCQKPKFKISRRQQRLKLKANANM